MRVSEEIINIWVFCAVYPISKSSVQKKVLELASSFNKFIKYPKAKRGQSYTEKVKKNCQEILKHPLTSFVMMTRNDMKLKSLLS